jgi:hypothetical protein
VSALEGRCLCGAVEVRVSAHAGEVSACHCSYCRRWTGSAMWCLAAGDGAVEAGGPVRTWRSTPFSVRAWCGTCGTHLWIRDDDGDYDLVPGLFEGAAGLPMVREVYADRALASVRLAGDHPRVSAAEYQAAHRFVEGGP